MGMYSRGGPGLWHAMKREWSSWAREEAPGPAQKKLAPPRTSIRSVLWAEAGSTGRSGQARAVAEPPSVRGRQPEPGHLQVDALLQLWSPDVPDFKATPGKGSQGVIPGRLKGTGSKQAPLSQGPPHGTPS